MTYLDGSTYFGEWDDGARNGWGTHCEESGAISTGEWKNDKKDGIMIQFHADQLPKWTFQIWKVKLKFERCLDQSDPLNHSEIFSGINQGNIEDFKKKIFDQNLSPSYFQQLLEEDHRTEVKFEDGSTYYGRLSLTKREGDGSMIFSDGSKYFGSWQNNVFHGLGTFEIQGHQVYTGEFVNGLKEGGGTEWYGFDQLNRYEGEWKDGKKHGWGTFHFENGSKFIGHWKNGCPIMTNNENFSSHFLRSPLSSPNTSPQKPSKPSNRSSLPRFFSLPKRNTIETKTSFDIDLDLPTSEDSKIISPLSSPPSSSPISSPNKNETKQTKQKRATSARYGEEIQHAILSLDTSDKSESIPKSLVNRMLNLGSSLIYKDKENK